MPSVPIHRKRPPVLRRACDSVAERFWLWVLEPRVLFCAEHSLDGLTALPLSQPFLHDASATGTFASGQATAALVPASGGVPLLNSRSSASAKLFLDFDGAAASNWGTYSVTATPAYDQDGDTSTFSDAELANIQAIWARVAEKYSPFNLDVTTVDPGSYGNKVALRVVIGGDGAWLGAPAGGVAYVGGFSNSAPNTVYVFPENLANGHAKYTAEAAAHESGHGFGLQHQSTYDGSGNKIEEYNPGDALRAPIMGNSYDAPRGLWWQGPSSVSSTSIQNDLAIISNTTNGFGYRVDDHANVSATATPLLINGTSVSAAGVIESTADLDYFTFETNAGFLSLTAAVQAAGAMLDVRLELRDSAGTLIAASDSSSLGETISTSVPTGTYRLVVASHGSYGDIGQYAIAGTIVPPEDYVAPPANLGAAVASVSRIDLSWADQSNNELGFRIQRSTDGGANWLVLETVGPNTTAYADVGASGGVTYTYRVQAIGEVADSAFSNVASATTVPLAPTGLIATAASASQINLSWNDVTGETGYRIERSGDGLGGWTLLGTTAPNVTSFGNTGLNPGSTHYYRVVAIGAAGNSNPGNVAQATTTTTPPAAPTSLTAVVRAPFEIQLAWQDNAGDENGFAVERSTNGVNFTQIDAVAANATSYKATGLSAGVTYTFRVRAFIGNAYSGYSNSAAATAAGEPGPLNYASFPNSSGLTINGDGSVGGGALLLTDGRRDITSVFASAARDIRRFQAAFNFRIYNGNADGFTFTIQGNAPSAIGAGREDLGYGGIAGSVAVKFDINSNRGEGTSSTGLYTGGIEPTVPAIDLLASNINLRSGRVFGVTLDYDGTILRVSIRDTVSNVTAQQSYVVDIAGEVGGAYAWVGFTAATNQSQGTVQEIQSWSFTPIADVTAPTAQITDVTPSLRSTPVGSVQIVFSEPVAGFDLSDLTLTRNGNTLGLGAGQSLSSADGITWTLSGLGSIAGDGLYVLALNAAGSAIHDVAGNPLLVGAAESWTVRSVGNISGRVFEDDDSDDVQDAGEPSLAGFMIYVDGNGNGAWDAGEASATSDSFGNYVIAGVPLGSHPVRQAPHAGWIATDSGDLAHVADITLNADASGVLFANFPATLSGSGDVEVQFDSAGSWLLISISGGVSDGEYRVDASIAMENLHLHVHSGALARFKDSLSLASLRVGDGGRAQIAQGGARVLRLRGLEIEGDGTLDLADNDLIVQSADPAEREAMMALMRQWIVSGRNGGAWNGSGIVSSAARDDVTGLSGLGLLRNFNGHGAIRQSFAGFAVDENALLIRHTWTGDADLDGRITSDDYKWIDRGFLTRASDQQAGDFDWSGLVDLEDYLLIDGGFFQQWQVL